MFLNEGEQENALLHHHVDKESIGAFGMSFALLIIAKYWQKTLFQGAVGDKEVEQEILGEIDPNEMERIMNVLLL
ncbi:hypothetical protein J31TS6_62200 [Brevibacillus reuszeri]|nr:hypothetical protein J31TS6_62200 [Brevibacillus reuszeri]